MQDLEKNKKNFDNLNMIAVGISVDPTPSKKAWAQHLKIKRTRLLSDFWPHGTVAQQYGIFKQDDGISERANIIVDEERNIMFMKIYPISQLPDIAEILRFLKKKAR
jgi:peroxiredoxin